MNQMHDGCLSEVKTIGELLLGWPKGGSFYVVLSWRFILAIFRRLCLVGSTTLCFLLLNLTSEENIFVEISLGGTPFFLP